LEPKPSVKVVWKLAGPCADSATVRSLPLSLPTVTEYSNAERGVPRSDGRRDLTLSLAGVSVPTVSVSGSSADCSRLPLAPSTTWCDPGLASFGTSTRNCRLTLSFCPGIAEATGWPPPRMSIFHPLGTPDSDSAMASGARPEFCILIRMVEISPARTVWAG
jgi:hypothetical protein